MIVMEILKLEHDTIVIVRNWDAQKSTINLTCTNPEIQLVNNRCPVIIIIIAPKNILTIVNARNWDAQQSTI